MRAGLRWTLLATLALSAAALWWPRAAPRLVAARPRETAPAEPASKSLLSVATADAPLPAALPPWDLPPAVRDPFSNSAPPAIPAPAPARPVAPPVAMTPIVAQPAPMQAPSALPRYLGSMQTPQGERLVLLLRGDTAVIARVGLGFDDGYVVRSVTAQAVRLVHAASGTNVDIAVPAPPWDSTLTMTPESAASAPVPANVSSLAR